ncbi:GH25 family lysozyme [Levilactobacillus brevis]|nr:GH25 family lysozyme [Levilactobacillus brevis]
MPRLDMVDTSNNNGIMTKANWLSMKKYGVRAMVAKLSEGTFFTDQTAKTSIRNAVKAGLHVNGYHFARFTTVAGAKAEAQMAARCAFNAGLGKDAVIVLDFEATNSGWSRNAAIIKAWVAEVKRMGYPKTDVYTMGSWTNSMPLNNSSRGGWIANYPSNPAGLKLYGSYNGWQWTSTHKFQDVAFKYKVDNFPAGTVFAIAKVVTYGKITRFQLSNGYYITSNQDNVNRLYYSVDGGVKRVKSVRGTHRYKDKALKHVVDWQPAGTEFDVAKIVKYGDTTRIQLANGLFISGNKKINKFVK